MNPRARSPRDVSPKVGRAGAEQRLDEPAGTKPAGPVVARATTFDRGLDEPAGTKPAGQRPKK